MGRLSDLTLSEGATLLCSNWLLEGRWGETDTETCVDTVCVCLCLLLEKEIDEKIFKINTSFHKL